MKLNRPYASGLLLVFFWQLLVLFYSPFVGATVRPIMKDFSKKGELSIKAIQDVKGDSAATGYFVEEVLEEDYHAPENLQYSIPSHYEFHYAFQLVKDCHEFHSEQLLPPEK